MRRRFGRGRRNQRSAGPGQGSIDAGRLCERVVEAGIAGATALEPATPDDIPDHLAAIGVGERDGRPLVVAYAPSNGGDAAFAALAHARSLSEAEFDGEVVAICPHWTSEARRRLAWIGTTPFAFRAIAAAPLDDDPSIVAERIDAGLQQDPRRIADRLANPADRALFLRALAGLEGLAAKHGGIVRGVGDHVELVLLSRISTALRADDGVILESIVPDKATDRLDDASLATALDRLEGSLRKRLNDRRIRTSDEGLRAEWWPGLVAAERVREAAMWPLAGSDPELLDLVGVSSEGVPVVGAMRSRLSLADLGAIIDAANAVQSSLPALLSEAEAPVRLGTLRLALAGQEIDASVLALLPLLSVEIGVYDIVSRRGRDAELRPRDVAAPQPARETRETRAPVVPSAPRPEAREEDAGAARERDRSESRGEGGDAADADAGEAGDADRESSARRGGSRRRRGRRGGAGREPRVARETDEGADASEGGAAKEDSRPERRFEEVSLFDLDASNGEEESAPRRSRRGRGRRRGGRSRSTGSEAGEAADAPSPDAPDADDSEGESRGSRSRRRRRAGAREPESASAPEPDSVSDDDDDSVDDLAEAGIPIVADIEEPDVVEEPTYDDEEDAEPAVQAEEVAGKDAKVVPPAEPEGLLQRARRRAAIVVHADRGSLIAGLLLARDIRLLEGFWVYGQEDLMTFFRSVATDLRDQTPIFVVGFTASPARDTIQAASLYADRIAWFDHHDWPPEDLEGLRAAIGAAQVIVTPGMESPIAAVLSERTRRSRFSDKVVELATGRFSQHDYERWGRVWWDRLGGIASRPGERRADLDALLAGRPSDLAKEAALVQTPDPPPEVAFVSGQDFRLVHFGGLRMVVVPVPDDVDLHLAARVARERYEAELSLAFRQGDELLVLGGEEGRTRKTLNLGGMVAHLGSKHVWIEPMPSEDFVARLRVHDLATHPDRLDAVITEIAMGRSIFEG